VKDFFKFLGLFRIVNELYNIEYNVRHVGRGEAGGAYAPSVFWGKGGICPLP
jgi:hypothetical protein